MASLIGPTEVVSSLMISFCLIGVVSFTLKDAGHNFRLSTVNLPTVFYRLMYRSEFTSHGDALGSEYRFSMNTASSMAYTL